MPLRLILKIRDLQFQGKKRLRPTPERSAAAAALAGQCRFCSGRRFAPQRSLVLVGSVTQSSALLALANDPVWFCLRTEPKREHLAAVGLRRHFGIECLSPRLRFRKLTQRGPVWFVEAMFPGYLFAKFVYSTQRRAVESSHGVRGIVRFGDRLATLQEEIIAALQSKAGSDEVVTIDSSPKIGQPVHIVEGPFQGLEVVVTQLLPAKERIRVLLDFLGRSLEIEVPTGKVLPA